MKINVISIIICLFTLDMYAQTICADHELDYCYKQVTKALETMEPYNYNMEPRNIFNGQTTWNCREASAKEWCSGFWPGILWMTYETHNDKKILKAAKGYTKSIFNIINQPIYDHDLGFLIINSILKGYEQTNCNKYKKIALLAADSLATLYNPKVGTILSWPRHITDYGGHNTIMDNMINLELLFWASENGGNKMLKNIAINHATTTMQHHFRPDGSAFHVAIYDTITGKFIKAQTHQGYANYSMWARGQAWAIYGYTMVYRYTHDKVFLDFAEKVTDIYLKRLTENSTDLIPIWDFDDPRKNMAPKDASAACIVASALLELQKYTTTKKAKIYKQLAEDMLLSLSSEKYQSRQNNVGFLMHSTGHHPANSEIDATIIYADYYYIEALTRLKKLQQ